MFDIGFWEIAVIGVIALLVIGPERLPAVARNVGRWVGRMRRYVSHVKQDIEREIHADEVRQLLENPEGLDGIRDMARETAAVVEDTRKEIGGVMREAQNTIHNPVGSAAVESTQNPASTPAAEANAWVSSGASYEARDKLAHTGSSGDPSGDPSGDGKGVDTASGAAADRLVPHHALDEDPFAPANLAGVTPEPPSGAQDPAPESDSAADERADAERQSPSTSDPSSDEQRTERPGQR